MKRNPVVQTVPYEDDEQIDFVGWLDGIGLKYTAIPNHTYNPHKSQQSKNHRLGLRKGFPDMVVLVGPDQSSDGEGYFLAIEMKRLKDSTTSPEQRAWVDSINALGTHNVVAYICKGSDVAKRTVSHYLKSSTTFSPF